MGRDVKIIVGGSKIKASIEGLGPIHLYSQGKGEVLTSHIGKRSNNTCANRRGTDITSHNILGPIIERAN